MMRTHFELVSPAFEGGQPIPREYTCDGGDAPPKLHWNNAPYETRSFVLIADDPDAGPGTFTHWVVYDIPPYIQDLGDGEGLGTLGRNDFHFRGYGGPCPAHNRPQHRYFFRLYALDRDTLDLPPGASRSDVERAMEGHIISETTLMGRYQR